MLRMCSWAAAGGGALLALGACFPQFGEYVEDGGSGGALVGGRGGSQPLPACDGGVCVEVPTGWEGPVVLTAVDGVCSGAYADEIAAGETNLGGEPSSCGCECGPASGSTCPTATVTRHFAAGCATLNDTIAVPASGCTAIAVFNAGSWTATAQPEGGSCAPVDSAFTPPPTFESRTVCGPTVTSLCKDGSACAPLPGPGLEPRICIVEEGDVECPSPSFGVKTLLFTQGHDDTRGCDVDCTCQAPTAICGGTVSGRQTTTCGSAQDGLTVGMCDDSYVDSNQSLQYFPTLTTEGSCSPAPRVPTGAVVGLSPITLCCSGIL